MIQVAPPSVERPSSAAWLPTALQPFSRRIPLFLTVLLVAVVGAMMWLAHDRIYTTVVRVELERLQASSNQIATSLQASAQRMEREATRLAADSTIVRRLGRIPSAADR